PNAHVSGTVAVPPIPNAADAGNYLPFYIGGCQGNPNGCDAYIDEVQVYDHALTPPEIQGIGKCKQIAGTKGMTWLHAATNAQTGTITIGCSGCNATNGDTVCSLKSPLLCIYKPTPPFPLPDG